MLLNEVKEKQVEVHDDKEMRIDIDLSEETLKSYKYFKRLVHTPFFLDRGSAAKTLITQYRQLRRLGNVVIYPSEKIW